jgi:Protein of unknown function (DUF2855)
MLFGIGMPFIYSSAMNSAHTPSHATSLPLTQLWVNKKTLNQTALHRFPSSALAAGQVRLAVNSFALTSNNITYAAFGDAMNYWGFYPTHDAEWGIVPVWGFATVTQSGSEGIAVGDRFYGYYPMASEVVLTPGKVRPTGFVDAAAHRAALHGVYNQYHRTALDAFHSAEDSEQSNAVEALLRPLFLTSWLIDDFFDSESFFGANVAILSSASSKTAYGTAYCLKQRAGLEVVGLTSAANVAFCEGLGCYDRVLTYEQLNAIAADARCIYIDFAGNAALRLAIHTRFANLAYSCSIGGTHMADLGSGKGLPGPRAVLFFAPAQSAKRVADWGAAEFGKRIVTAWHSFTRHATRAENPWLSPQFHYGDAALQAAYQGVLAGKGDPSHGHILGFSV